MPTPFRALLLVPLVPLFLLALPGPVSADDPTPAEALAELQRLETIRRAEAAGLDTTELTIGLEFPDLDAEELWEIYASDYAGGEQWELRDVVDAPEEIRELARSVCLIVDRDDLTQNVDGTYTLAHETVDLDEVIGVNATRPVAESLATGFRMGAAIVGTAGHAASCGVEDLAFLFGFTSDAFPEPPYVFSEKQVYFGNCTRAFDMDDVQDWSAIIVHQNIHEDYPAIEGFEEHVLHTPAVMIGHPRGLPMQYSGVGAIHADLEDGKHFATDLYAFSGNSGSPVFNGDDVVGIHLGWGGCHETSCPALPCDPLSESCAVDCCASRELSVKKVKDFFEPLFFHADSVLASTVPVRVGAEVFYLRPGEVLRVEPRGRTVALLTKDRRGVSVWRPLPQDLIDANREFDVSETVAGSNRKSGRFELRPRQTTGGQ